MEGDYPFVKGHCSSLYQMLLYINYHPTILHFHLYYEGTICIRYILPHY